jgi:organic radical activating enzyme
MKMELNKIKKMLLRSNITEEMMRTINALGKNPKRPLGKINPWAWCLEPVRGCNLACWHCPARLLPQNKYEYMSEQTWISAWKIIKELTPYCRIEMANTGEPTLHPNILEFIKIARTISPNSQIQITTNGTTLIQNKITYKQLFDSGINIIYVDMYAPKERHIDLAKKSGYDFYKYYESSKKVPNAWTYHNNPNIQFIALSEIPDNWPIQKIKRGGLGTFLNNIDFEKAKKINIVPVINAPERRCSQPMKYVQVMASGTYLMCCQDAFNKAGILNNVNEGINGFFKFWLGRYMQSTRKILRAKNRMGHPICYKCNTIFSRCDMKFWQKETFNYWWNGKILKGLEGVEWLIRKESIGKNKKNIPKQLTFNES